MKQTTPYLEAALKENVAVWGRGYHYKLLYFATSPAAPPLDDRMRCKQLAVFLFSKLVCCQFVISCFKIFPILLPLPLNFEFMPPRTQTSATRHIPTWRNKQSLWLSDHLTWLSWQVVWGDWIERERATTLLYFSLLSIGNNIYYV